MARVVRLDSRIGVGKRGAALAMAGLLAGTMLSGADRSKPERIAVPKIVIGESEIVFDDPIVPLAVSKRGFGPEQATGRPDVPQAGDNSAAWASQTPDGQREWLLCEYATPIEARAIVVYESYNPGALVRISAFNAAGDETIAWEGDDPTPRGRPRGISVIPVKLDFAVQRIRLSIDSPAVPGWNEIDAVGIEDAGGTIHWASKAEASSTFGAAFGNAIPGNAKRAYSPEQAAGAPDTPGPGDQSTAWASATPDNQPEWLICEFKKPRIPSEIVVYENNAPGAITRISVIDADDKETTIWEGVDPTPRDQPWGVSVFPVKLDAPIRKLKLYINSPEVPGYNEIDAVGLRSLGEDVEWASKVEASSIYGYGGYSMSSRDGMMQSSRAGEKAIQDLQKEIQGLRKQVDELQQIRQEFKELKASLKEESKK